MESEEIFYYLQLLFDDRGTRDKAYGREFIASEDSTDFSLAGQNKPQILHRAKGVHRTGTKKWYGIEEKLPTIELVIETPDMNYLDSTIMLENYCVSKRQKVSRATLVFIARVLYLDRLKNFRSELVLACDNVGIVNKEFTRIKGEWIDYLDGYINGPIRPVLHIYDVAKSRGISYKNINVEFS